MKHATRTTAASLRPSDRVGGEITPIWCHMWYAKSGRLQNVPKIVQNSNARKRCFFFTFGPETVSVFRPRGKILKNATVFGRERQVAQA
jgi:hypothetical protein